MKTTPLIAIILIAMGIIAFAFYGITYTTREKVIDIGSLQVTAEKTRTVQWPPIIGTVGVVAGVVLLIAASRKGPFGHAT